jgi:hypothetical protein
MSMLIDSQITSFNTSLPLIIQSHMSAGYIICGIAMLAIYYLDASGSRAGRVFPDTSHN